MRLLHQHIVEGDTLSETSRSRLGFEEFLPILIEDFVPLWNLK